MLREDWIVCFAAVEVLRCAAMLLSVEMSIGNGSELLPPGDGA
jgi:hypothetical protein